MWDLNVEMDDLVYARFINDDIGYGAFANRDLEP